MRADNEIWKIIFEIIREQMLLRGFEVDVLQAYQPTQQGVPTKSTITLHSLSSQRYGFPEDECYYDQGLDAIVRRESYWLERTYQVDALAIQNPSETNNPTAFDLVEQVASILQTGIVVEYLQANDIGILRIQPMRIIYFVDDRGRHEQIPSFDFTLSYRQILLSTAVPITEITAEIYEV